MNGYLLNSLRLKYNHDQSLRRHPDERIIHQTSHQNTTQAFQKLAPPRMDVMRSPVQQVRKGEDDYEISKVTGGAGPIYNFLAPPEYLKSDISDGPDKKKYLVYYFTYLYPMTPVDKWEQMSVQKLQDYYDNLNFWYTFNSSWGVAPMPKTLSDNVVDKWEKNTFFQSGTIVQSSITSWGWGLDNQGQRFYLASRLNNASQVDPEFTYTTKHGHKKTIITVATEKEYWDTVIGNKIEVTSWGWNPYPFGIYAQGPFTGTGNFLDIPERSIVGTCHWDIIWQCKASNVSDETIWSENFNHELSRVITGRVYMPGVDMTPWVVKHKLDGSWEWGNINDQGGYTPLLMCYHCFISGGFGGIGAPWTGNYGEFMSTWNSNPGSQWGAGYQYAVVIQETKGPDGKTMMTMPVDQSIPASANLPGGFSRSSDKMWQCYRHFFMDYIHQWSTNWVQQMWRYPIFYSYTTEDGTDLFQNTGPGVANPSDDLMMAMTTGNFDIVHYSSWGKSMRPKSLSKFSHDPMTWSHTQLASGEIVHKNVEGFPTGYMKNKGAGYQFVIRTQMPNVNGNINTEFADFRVLIPGNLADGSGDQELWAEMFTSFCKDYMFTVDPFDENNYQSFTGDYEPILPEVKPVSVDPKPDNWQAQNNILINKAFFNFDVYSGKWTTSLAYTGKQGSNYLAFPQYPGEVSGNGALQLHNPTNKGEITDLCNEPDASKNIDPKPFKDQTAELGGNIKCYEKKGYGCPTSTEDPDNWWQCSQLTIAAEGQQYYPSATDSFGTGIVGFQGNGSVANIGSSQTRWWMNSKKIAWRFNTPLANRLIIKNGVRLYEDYKPESDPQTFMKWDWKKITLLSLLVLMVGGLIFVIIKKPQNKNNLIKILGAGIILSSMLFGLLFMYEKCEKEEKKLQTYFSLVYPMVPIKRWKNMSRGDLRKFFCSLHHWYRGNGLPSPEDYIGTKEWNNAPPFGKNSSWKDFTTRKNCIQGAPRAINETDNKVVIGYDNKVGTTPTETPCGILWRGRQLQSRGGNIQTSTFFEPTYNLWVDTFNNQASVNDTDINAWKNVQYVEVSSQWGPFPDGAYFDWAQGTGVWLKLGKHIVGYSGLDVTRRVGEELLPKLGDDSMWNGFTDIYFQEWQRTGIDNMKVDYNGAIYNQDKNGVFGLYGSIIMTQAQWHQIKNAVKGGSWMQSDESNLDYCADGKFYKMLTQYIEPQYYNADSNVWQPNMPDDQGHVATYPFPLPFGTEEFRGNNDGSPIVNEYSLRMPWKYQLFNIALMTRSFCLDAVFLNEYAIPVSSLENGRGQYNYVDLLKANVNNPLKTLRTWDQAITIIMSLIQAPIAHPFFSKYARTLTNNFAPANSDGPLAVLTNDTEWGSGTWGSGDGPSPKRIQTGTLDKNVYLQDTKQSGGAVLSQPGALPQLLAADLEIDHWMSALSTLIGYDTCARIQHWCGNKSLCYDIEIIAFRIPIPGNLITNVLYSNIYEIWNKAYAEGWLTVRDPFTSNSNVYNDVYDDIYSGSTTDKTENASWNRPAWIDYDPQNNLYGWHCESLPTYYVNQRLAYPQISCEQVGLSNAFPEYNEFIFNHFHALLHR